METETENLGTFVELGRKSALCGMLSLSTLEISPWKLLTLGSKIVVQFKGREVKFRERLSFLL